MEELSEDFKFEWNSERCKNCRFLSKNTRQDDVAILGCNASSKREVIGSVRNGFYNTVTGFTPPKECPYYLEFAFAMEEEKCKEIQNDDFFSKAIMEDYENNPDLE